MNSHNLPGIFLLICYILYNNFENVLVFTCKLNVSEFRQGNVFMIPSLVNLFYPLSSLLTLLSLFILTPLSLFHGSDRSS